MSDWGAAVPALASALVLIVAPGALLAWAMGLRGVSLAGAAPVFSLASIGVSGLLTSSSMRFGWWTPIVFAAIVAAALTLLRRRQRHIRTFSSSSSTSDLVAIAAGIAATAITAVIAFGAVPSPDAISNTYDAVFHLNAAAAILDTGQASSASLYTLTHPEQTVAFYPAVWHSLVAATASLSGATIPVATNVAWIVGGVLPWTFGSVWLTDTLFRKLTPHRTSLLSTAALASSGFAAFPYLLLDWGTLYPSGLAYSLLPAGVALGVHLTAPLLRTSNATWKPEVVDLRWPYWVALALWVAASVLTHPRSTVTWFLLVGPLLLAGLFVASRGYASTQRRRILVLSAWTAAAFGLTAAGIAAVSFLYGYYGVSARPIADRLNGGPAVARQGMVESAWQVLISTPISSPSQTQLPPAWILGGAVLASLIAVARIRGLRWILVSYAIVAVLYCLAAGSNADIAKVATALWYKDKYRLFAVLPTLAVPILAWGLVRFAVLLRARLPGASVPGVAAVLSSGLLISAWLSPTMAVMRAEIGTVFASPMSDKAGGILDTEQRQLFQRLPSLIAPGEVVAGNPWDGSALTWAIGDRQSLFPHLQGDWGADRDLIAGRLDQAASDPAVCAALRRLNVHYVVADPQRLWNNTAEAARFAGIDRAVGSDVLQEVARNGSAALFRIVACR